MKNSKSENKFTTSTSGKPQRIILLESYFTCSFLIYSSFSSNITESIYLTDYNYLFKHLLVANSNHTSPT